MHINTFCCHVCPSNIKSNLCGSQDSLFYQNFILHKTLKIHEECAVNSLLIFAVVPGVLIKILHHPNMYI